MSLSKNPILWDRKEGIKFKTPSGKIEFFSQNLAKFFPDDEERPPVPHWIEKGVSHDERVSSERATKYPLLVLSNHPHWRMHANADDITWTREAPTCKVKAWDGYLYEPVWMHPSDAAARGIEDGDIVKMYNERGVVLGGAYVSQRVMGTRLNTVPLAVRTSACIDDVYDGIGLAEVVEELVSKPLALVGFRDQSGDIDEFYSGGNRIWLVEQFAYPDEPFVRYRDDTLVGLNGAERVIGHLGAGP